MNDFGTRIRDLRIQAGISQKKLADSTNISIKTIQRCEQGKRPDTYTLVKLATYYNISTDYLLGLKGYRERLKERNEKIKDYGNGVSKIYSDYIRCLNENRIDHNADYYWIVMKDNYIGGKTKWVGWSDAAQTIEIRKLCVVNPTEAIKMCCQLEERPLIINNEMDLLIYRIYGGQAIVKKDICEIYMPEFNKEYKRKLEN